MGDGDGLAVLFELNLLFLFTLLYAENHNIKKYCYNKNLDN